MTKIDINVGSLEEYIVEKEGYSPLRVRLFKYYDETYWEISYNKNQYGLIWNKVDTPLQLNMREQIKFYNAKPTYMVGQPWDKYIHNDPELYKNKDLK